MADAAIDNDVVFKAACYGLLEALLAALPGAPYTHGVLGTARFVLPKLLRKRPPIRAAEASVDLERALATLETLEPTAEEVTLSAALEFEAQLQNLGLHAGECLLCAILWQRGLRHLLTGDKVAIEALSAMTPPVGVDPAAFHGKLICLEQAMLWLLQATTEPATIRATVCAERDVDPAMRVCFSCASPEVGITSWVEGLSSHVTSLRNVAGPLLAPSDAQTMGNQVRDSSPHPSEGLP